MLPADDNVVFEVLRFVYCGSVCFHLGFYSRFARFLAVIDYLGIEEMTERGCCASIFAEQGFVHWLRNLPLEELLALLQDDDIIGWRDGTQGAVGFSIRRAFLAKVLEVRPQDLIAGVLGRELHRRLIDCASPIVEVAGSGHLLLPGPVLYAGLHGPSSTRELDLIGSAPMLDAVASETWMGQAWHNGRRVHASDTRQKLLQGCSPHGRLVVLCEGSAGQRAFDATLRAAEDRTRQWPEERSRFKDELRWLLAAAAAVEQQGYDLTPVSVVYPNHNAMAQDVQLAVDDLGHTFVDHVRPGGVAETAGLASGWALARQPKELTLRQSGQHSWQPLDGYALHFCPPGSGTIVVSFQARPLGFSWRRRQQGICVVKVLADGEAHIHRVMVGSTIKHITSAGTAVSDIESLAAILKSNQVPEAIAFQLPTVALPAQMVAGITFEERAAALAEADSAGPDVQDGPLANVAASTAAEQRVFVAHVPREHPCELHGLAPGWQLKHIGSQREAGGGHAAPAADAEITSVAQLPAELRGPFDVSLTFAPPSPMAPLFPLDVPHEASLPPVGWDERHCPAIWRQFPLAGFQEGRVGPLQTIRGRTRWPPQANPADDNEEHTSGSPQMDSGRLVSPSQRADIEAAPMEDHDGASSSARPANDDALGLEIGIVVLGFLPPRGVAARRLIAEALPNHGWRRELSRALQHAERDILDFQQERSPPLIATCLHWRFVKPGHPEPESILEHNWVDGVVLGESLPQIMFRWAAEAHQRHLQPLLAQGGEAATEAPTASGESPQPLTVCW